MILRTPFYRESFRYSPFISQSTILRSYSGLNDVHGSLTVNHDRWRRRQRHPPPHHIRLLKGSQYGLFSRRFIQFAVEDAVAKDFVEWLRNTEAPDETFWASLQHHEGLLDGRRVPGSVFDAASVTERNATKRRNPEDVPYLAAFVNWVHDVDRKPQCRPDGKPASQI